MRQRFLKSFNTNQGTTPDTIFFATIDGATALELPKEVLPLLEDLRKSTDIDYSKYLFSESAVNDFIALLEVEGAMANTIASESIIHQENKMNWLIFFGAIFIALFVACMISLFENGLHIPNYKDLFISDRYASVTIVIGTAITLVLISLHELGHVISARIAGISSRLRLNTRLHYLVFEADVTGIWGLSKAYRMLVYTSGILVDLAIIFLAIALLSIDSTWVKTILGYIIVVNLMSIIWQFQIYMRTDVYFVLMDVLSKPNLYDSALKDLLNFYRGRLVTSRTSVIYGHFVAVSSTVAIVAFVTFGAPFLRDMFIISYNNIANGVLTGNYLLVFDGLIAFLIEISFFLAAMIIASKKHWPAVRGIISDTGKVKELNR